MTSKQITQAKRAAIRAQATAQRALDVAKRAAPKAAPTRIVASKPPQKQKSGGKKKQKGKSAIPHSLASGTATFYSGDFHTEFSISSSQSNILIVGNNGVNATVAGMIVRNGTAPNISLSYYTYSSPRISVDGSNGGPATGRASGLSLEIVNTTQSMNAGGVVFVVPLDQRIKLTGAPSAIYNDTSGTLFDGIVQDITQYANERPISGADLLRRKVFRTTVADPSAFLRFNQWLGAYTVSGNTAAYSQFDSFMSEFAMWPSSTFSPRAMTFYAVVFAAPATTQTYSITVRPTWYLRWPTSHVAAAWQKPVPAVPRAK